MTLGRAYDEIMEHVVITEQMRQRILSRVEDAGCARFGHAGRVPARRRYWAAAAACAALLAAGGTILPWYLDGRQTEPMPGHVETVPPFTEVASLAELEAAVGFEVEELTDLPFAVTDTVYTVFSGEMAEIRYCGEDETAVLRKAPGTEDPSGDSTPYEETYALDMGGSTVLLKGEGGLYVLAQWQEDGCACSVRLTEGSDRAAWERMLQPLF